MRILAIDPGNQESAFVLMFDGSIEAFGKLENDKMMEQISETDCECNYELAIEGIASYGMAVGKEVFDTCVWIGRFWQWSEAKTKRLVYRLEVKNHLCHSSKANDSNIRQALIDRFGGPQETKKGGKLYGVSKDIWSALAVACTYYDLHVKKEG